MTTFGLALESRLKTVTEASKNQKAAERRATMELNKWLASDGDAGVMRGRFRDPLAEMIRRS